MRHLRRGLLLSHLSLGALFWATGELQATIYDWSEEDGIRELRLNIPDSIGSSGVRGLLIHGNTYQGDSLDQATDPELVAFASRIDFAILATAEWYNFSESDDSELILFESIIQAFATTTGHSELVNAPWLPTGFSNGGQMSYGLASKRPDKVIAFITSKGCCYNTFTPTEATRQIPGLLFAGTLDSDIRRDNIELLYKTNRALGALWAWVEEEAVGHSEGNENHLKLPFLAEAYRLRYPSDQSPVDGPVQLNDLVQNDGWLVDPATWSTGYTEIFPFTTIEDDPLNDVLNYGWLPSEKMAMLYRGFSSRLKVTENISTVTSPIAISNTIQYEPPLVSGLNWTEVEAFVDGFSLGSVSASATPSWTVDFTYGGMYTFHSVITLANGSRRVSYLNRVFIDGEVPQSSFDNWLYDSYAPALQSPDTIPSGASDSLIESYAFDLQNNPYNRPTISPSESGMTFQFIQRAGLAESGVELEVQVATDIVNGPWETIPVDAPSYQLEGNVVTIELSEDDAPSKFAQVILTVSE